MCLFSFKSVKRLFLIIYHLRNKSKKVLRSGEKDVKTQKGKIMNKIDEFVSRVSEAFNSCVDSVRNQELWEDYANVQLPEDLTQSEKTELINKLNNNVVHYYMYADLATIIENGETAKSIMVYVDDVSSWWRFEA